MCSYPETTMEAFQHFNKVTSQTSLVDVLCGDTSGETLYMLKKSYFRLSALVHPDRGGKVSPTEANSSFQTLQRAFQQAKNLYEMNRTNELETEFIISGAVMFSFRISEVESKAINEDSDFYDGNERRQQEQSSTYDVVLLDFKLT